MKCYILLGGCWADKAFICRTYSRVEDYCDDRDPHLGFRLIKKLKK